LFEIGEGREQVVGLCGEAVELAHEKQYCVADEVW
jgi:hypothetical protein